jgi:hypothetical protein
MNPSDEAVEAAYDALTGDIDKAKIRAVLEAAYQVDGVLLGTRPQPTLDLDEVGRRFEAVLDTPDGLFSVGSLIGVIEDLVRPLPTREQIAGVLREHGVEGVSGLGVEQILCSCYTGWRSVAEYRAHLRDALAALFSGGEE